MNLETLLTYFERFDYEDDCAYYARKDDELMLVAYEEDTKVPLLLAFLNVYDDGGVLGFTHDPDQEAVVNLSFEYTDNIPVDVFRPIE